MPKLPKQESGTLFTKNMRSFQISIFHICDLFKFGQKISDIFDFMPKFAIFLNFSTEKNRDLFDFKGPKCAICFDFKGTKCAIFSISKVENLRSFRNSFRPAAHPHPTPDRVPPPGIVPIDLDYLDSGACLHVCVVYLIAQATEHCQHGGGGWPWV